jgi:hypothetical protein
MPLKPPPSQSSLKEKNLNSAAKKYGTNIRVRQKASLKQGEGAVTMDDLG